MGRSSIGLDIGTRAIRMAEVEGGGASPTLTRFGRVLLPSGAVEHGEIRDVMAVTQAITTLKGRLGLSGKSVHVGIANRRVIVRLIEMPYLSAADLEGAIRFQAQDHIPIPLDDAVMDYEVLDEIQKEDGERSMRVMVVAAERTTITPLIEAIRGAKFDIASLELNAYPLVRCFGDGSQQTQAIVDIGAGVTDVVVHREGKIRFTRILPTFGGDEFTSAIASSLGVQRDEAETLKRRASSLLESRAGQPVGVGAASPMSFRSREGYSASGESPNMSAQDTNAADEQGVESSSSSSRKPMAPGSRGGSGAGGTGESGDKLSDLDRVVRVVEPILDRFVSEVRGSLDFYSTQPGAPALEKVILTGGGALMGGIKERLGASLDIEIEHGHPFSRVPIGSVEVSSEERTVAEPFMAVAVGLALAGGGK